MTALSALAAPSRYSDYFIETFEASPVHPLSQELQSLLAPPACREALATSPPKPSMRIKRMASYEVQGGVRNDNARGFAVEIKAFSNYDREADPIFMRIMQDWQTQYGFSREQVSALIRTQQKLDKSRVKFIRIQNPTSQLFSAIRIYDSSPVMKYRGEDWVPPLASADAPDVSEIVFPGFKLAEALRSADVPKSRFTWSLGLMDSSGAQKGAASTMFSQVADLLDYHFNQREFFTLERLNEIRADDVDIVFYANENMRAFYEGKMKISPLKDTAGQEILLTPNLQSGSQARFNLYHIKGSDFIARYMKPVFLEPSFHERPWQGTLNSTLPYVQEKLKAALAQTDTSRYAISDLRGFLQKIIRVARPVAVGLRRAGGPTETEITDLLLAAVILRKQLKTEMLSQWQNPENIELLLGIARIFGDRGLPQTAENLEFLTKAQAFKVLGLVSSLVDDPVLYFINRLGKQAPKP